RDDDGVSQRIEPEVVLDEIADLAAAFANQGDDGDVRGGAAGEHAKEGALADAGAGEDANALTAAEGEHAVDCSDAGRERLRDGFAVKGMRGLGARRGVPNSGQLAA